MKLHTSVLLSLCLIACGDKDTGEEPDPVDPLEVDDDGDGFTENQGDCDDADADLNPGATEVCDEVDNDCDGLVDDDDDNLDSSTGSTYYEDFDEDGYGDPDVTMDACIMPDGYIDDMTDCDDTDAAIHPAAIEECDQIDNDCDDLIDDEDDDVDTSTGTEFYMDMDGDGEGDAANSVMACELPTGAVENMTDCNDSAEDLDGDGNPDGAWYNTADVDQDNLTTCGSDTDGDGAIDERDCDDLNNEVGSSDEDADGFIACIDDCDDDDEWTYPGAGELEADLTLCTTDWDEDGYGDADPWDGVDAGTDCDDMDEDLNPGDYDADGVSTCDGDCDDDDASLGIVDYDGDGFSYCYVDCWDSVVDVNEDGTPDSSLMYPGAAAMEPDLCGIDADADGYADADPYTPLPAGCIQLTLTDSGSYWDAAAVTVWLDGWAYEFCSDSAYTDEESCTAAGEEWSNGEYANTSASAYQVPEVYEVCTPIGEVALSYECTSTYDCNAHSIAIHYDANGDGVYDPTGELIYADGYIYTGVAPAQGIFADSDYGDAGSDCDDDDAASIGDADGDGHTWCSTDCDDDDATVNPDAGWCSDTTYTDEETCVAAGETWATETYYDGIDQNCDGMSDWDADMDGYDIAEYDCDGDGVFDDSCDLDGDGIDDFFAGDDCNDADASDIGDDDGDGYTACTWDCNDDATDADGDGVADGYDINPDATEIYYDGVDQNCDGWSDFDWDEDGDDIAEFDCDGDGVADASCDLDGDGVDDYVAGTDCDDEDYDLDGMDWDSDGQSSCDGDCDDTDADTYVGAAYLDDPDGDYCLTDADGDGYAAMSSPCYTVDMVDSYGDGWNGGVLVIYEDGVEVDSGLAADSFYTDQSAGRFFVASGSTESADFCVAGGATVTLDYTSGSWEGENTYTIYDSNGAVVFSDGPSPTTGAAIFEFTAAGMGGDCDDDDATIYTGATEVAGDGIDQDCDGVAD